MINKLVAMLKRLNFIYPVHQAIGYYAERAGYKSSQLDLLKRLPMEHDFFLSHAMTDTRYVASSSGGSLCQTGFSASTSPSV